MSLKELTFEKHKEAENTAFMKAVFDKKLPDDYWFDFTYQKWLIYNAIENVAGACGALKEFPPDIFRSHKLFLDYQEMTKKSNIKHKFREPAVEYQRYILSIYPDSEKIMAHVYTWHMGDMYGGQMIKRIVPGPYTSLEFKDPEKLKSLIRQRLNDNMADEANLAFDWAIKIFNTYDF
jgi:heme oxygenase